MKKLIILTFAAFCSVLVNAVPARRDGRQVRLPDGQEITVYQHGDEHFHWLTNENGEWIQRTEDGTFQVIPALTESQIERQRETSPKRKTQLRRVAAQAYPTNIAKEGLIILVNFQDVQFQTPAAEIDSMFMGADYSRNYTYDYVYKREHYHGTVTSHGSARQYFSDMSYGKYVPTFRVVGPVTVSREMKYYGENVGDEDKHPEAMVKEACELAAQQGVDFSVYDNDHDGEVDFVYILYAGEGEADGGAEETIWPHSWSLKDAGVTLKLNGKIVNTYACSNEMSATTREHDGVGTFCHEFSHVLGLPDLYETSGAGDWKTCGEWDVMDYGPYNNEGNTPPAYSGYERFFMGWVVPRVLKDSEAVSLHEINSSAEVLLLTTSGKHNLIGNDPDPATFWVLENRQLKGWDEYIPGHGMLITKVAYSYDLWYDNTVNNTERAMGVDIIEADGVAPMYNEYNTENGWFGKATDAFPAGATSYNGVTGYPIQKIAEENEVVTFAVGNAVTALGEIRSAAADGKYLRNGQIVILRDGIAYDLLGNMITEN